MKQFIALATVGVTAVFNPIDARAGDEGWAAFGGLIGGYVLSEVIHHRPQHRAVSHHHHAPAPACETVVVRPPPPAGHYEIHKVRVWVPGHYDYERDACGRRIKVWHKGHHKYETEKVWVPHPPVPRQHYRKAVHRY